MGKGKVEFVKAWFSRFELKVSNDLSVANLSKYILLVIGGKLSGHKNPLAAS